MGVVNADIQELLQIAKNIKNAIQSVESTQRAIIQRYRQLGAGWNDRRYKELGDVVQKCSNALNNILKTLLQGEKYVFQLEKALQEYDNVNLTGTAEADNLFIQELGNLAGSVGSDKAQYCLGVLTKGNIPFGYMDIISERYQNAEENVKRVFDNFTDKLNIQDADFPPDQLAHYSPASYMGHPRGVYYNAAADMDNPRGNGTTYFHELAHMIDHAATGNQGNMSNTCEFGRALMEDGQRILNVYNSATLEQQREFINSLRADHRTHSFQDLLDATTNGAISVGWVHPRDYWQDAGSLQTEAFAHFFEASMGSPDKLERFARYFPKSFTVFRRMIEDMLSDEDVRLTERSS